MGVFIEKGTLLYRNNELLIPKILTCEWIDGVKFDSKDALETAGFNVSQLMTTMVKVFADQLFRCGFVHCDPHPGNMIIRKHPTQNTYQIVLLDHGLYTISRPSFTTEYATFWKSLFTLDLNTLNKIATSWGISDTQSFASATLQRPWKMTSTPLHLQTLKYTVQDIYEMQINAKDKVSDFLKNTDKLPKELIFIGRNLNLIRSNNKAMGSPVNRINIMANYAATTLLLPLSAYAYLPFYKRIPIYFVSYCEYSIFKSTLFLSSITFYGNQVFQEIKSWMTGQKAKGHEDMLDQVAMMSMRKFGLQVDESTFDA